MSEESNSWKLCALENPLVPEDLDTKQLCERFLQCAQDVRMWWELYMFYPSEKSDLYLEVVMCLIRLTAYELDKRLKAEGKDTDSLDNFVNYARPADWDRRIEDFNAALKFVKDLLGKERRATATGKEAQAVQQTPIDEEMKPVPLPQKPPAADKNMQQRLLGGSPLRKHTHAQAPVSQQQKQH